jgi:hypothetical protein
MRVFSQLVFSVALLSLAACPAPPDAGGPQGGPPGGGPGGQGGPGQAHGPEGGNPGAPGGEANQGGHADKVPGAEAVTDTAGIPTFSALIDSGVQTITVKGSVPGVNKGQVDVQIAHKINDWTVPRIVHQGKVVNGSFSFQAPKEFTQPVYLVVVNDQNGNGPDPSDKMVYYPDTVTLGVSDVSLEFSATAEPAWVKEVFSQLPDPEKAPNLIKDGDPPGASDLPVPSNPPPDGIEDHPPGAMPLPAAKKPEDDTPAPPAED